jgi:APA family basic amino acid/polyamine antiporter
MTPTEAATGTGPRVTAEAPGFARRLGLFDISMMVMGGIIGSGIFMNPAVVARVVHTPFLMLGAWALGGAIALAGAFIYAELAARRPSVGGQYAYIREAFHPMLAFVYGWTLLLVVQPGGMAASAITFSRYFLDLTHLPIADWAVALLAVGALTAINCLGVRVGGTTQNVFMVLKVLAIVALIGFGLVATRIAAPTAGASPVHAPSLALLTAFGAAMVPVLFAYGGWQTASFVAGEVRAPRRTLPRGLVIGVLGVVALYLGVNWACLRALGPAGLAATTTPATEVMRAALGEPGARLIAAGIALSTLGFLSQCMLTAPRVYYAMAEDGLFFRSVARLHPKSRVPVVAIALQGVITAVIAVSGRYEQILNYVVPNDWIFFALSASCLFVLRGREGAEGDGARTPGHPWTTVAFVVVSALIVINIVAHEPRNCAIGLGLMLLGVPAYFAWARGR